MTERFILKLGQRVRIRPRSSGRPVAIPLPGSDRTLDPDWRSVTWNGYWLRWFLDGDLEVSELPPAEVAADAAAKKTKKQPAAPIAGGIEKE